MKKIVAIGLLILITTCKSSPYEELTVVEGSYIYFEDAAVLQTKNEIYGVFLNEKALELNKKAESYNSNSNNFIYVTVKGIVTTKKDKKILWDKKLEIVEIESITKIEQEEQKNTLKLGSN